MIILIYYFFHREGAKTLKSAKKDVKIDTKHPPAPKIKCEV